MKNHDLPREDKDAFYWDENLHGKSDLSGKRVLSNTVWGQAWCKHLESYSDFANRLPRGRTYVRDGLVKGIVVTPGKIRAKVIGSDSYHVTIFISPLPLPEWRKIKSECAGKIDSAIDLLQGKISKAILEIITSKKTGLFPDPRQIKMSCTCPDSAELCKHLAAVLYRFGNLLDTHPELLFLIRQLNHQELITAASATMELSSGDAYLDAHLAEIFGIELAETEEAVAAESVQMDLPLAAEELKPPKKKRKKPSQLNHQAKPVTKEPPRLSQIIPAQLLKPKTSASREPELQLHTTPAPTPPTIEQKPAKKTPIQKDSGRRWILSDTPFQLKPKTKKKKKKRKPPLMQLVITKTPGGGGIAKWVKYPKGFVPPPKKKK